MEKTTFDVLSQKQNLVEKLGSNPDLSNFVLAVLGRIIIIAAGLGKPLEGVKMGMIAANDLPSGDIQFSAQITFGDFSAMAASIWAPQKDFERYARSKALGMGMALQKNPGLATFFQNLVESIDQYANHKGLSFGKIKAQKAFITKGYCLVLQAGKNVLVN